MQVNNLRLFINFKSTRGFTLIEIVIYTVIFAIIFTTVTFFIRSSFISQQQTTNINQSVQTTHNALNRLLSTYRYVQFNTIVQVVQSGNQCLRYNDPSTGTSYIIYLNGTTLTKALWSGGAPTNPTTFYPGRFTTFNAIIVVGSSQTIQFQLAASGTTPGLGPVPTPKIITVQEHLANP